MNTDASMPGASEDVRMRSGDRVAVSGAAALPSWLPALLQLASPALPTGAFSYSQGLETACEAGWVSDEAGALAWIDAQWRQSFGSRELPAVRDAWIAATAGDASAFLDTDRAFLASRDNAEARAETLQVGAALVRWLGTLHSDSPWLAMARQAGGRPTGPCAYALCAIAQGLPREAAVFGWGFAWIENQVQAAVKLVPLGQSAGQRMQVALRPRLSDPLPEHPWSFSPVASILAMRHERQYTRLFRS